MLDGKAVVADHEVAVEDIVQEGRSACLGLGLGLDPECVCESAWGKNDGSGGG